MIKLFDYVVFENEKEFKEKIYAPFNDNEFYFDSNRIYEMPTIFPCYLKKISDIFVGGWYLVDKQEIIDYLQKDIEITTNILKTLENWG